MAIESSRALLKMAAGGSARRAVTVGRSHTETHGPALPRRQRPRGRCVKGSLEDRRLAIASAEPTGEAPAAARRGPRTTSLRSSHEAADRPPSKRKKCEKSLVKSELEGLECGSGSLTALGETLKTRDGDGHSKDSGDRDITQQKTGEDTPETNKEKQEKEHNVSLKPHSMKSSGAPSKMDDDENLCHHACTEEESSCKSVLSDGPSLEDADLPKKPIQLDNSAFLDEDSNQPMPVDRIFGDVGVLQDLPAVALPSTMMSRRESRKLHFIAKEDEEEEEEDVA
ncbi:UPF0688 protein C1orf174 homolog [Falco cherrug]|uniref:UPF0688 protein C1orf174 homolog n=1 Tax=Falco cherrug TaxID=345164 RepID=UPI002479482B|nr:UPF0688 protein C1orf174 homolog [Falco cherrug]